MMDMLSMSSLWPILSGVIERGLLFSLVVVAIYLTSSIIKFDDLTVEGSFGVGGGVTAICLLHEVNVIVALIAAIAAGALTGMLTGLLHTKLKLNNLMSGIIVTTGLFSITLKLASANMPINQHATIFGLVNNPLVLLLIISVGIISGVMWLMRTEIGLLLRALGENKKILTHIGKSVDGYTIGCLMLSNGITALAGSLFAQLSGYFSIWANVGMLIIGLIGLILAQMMSVRIGVMSIILGSTIYQALIALTIEFQVDPNWNKLITALLLVVLMAARKTRGK